MSDAWVYAVVTIAVAAVASAAVWRPRPGQAALLLVGPLLATAAAAGNVSGGLGRTALLVIPYTYLLVAASLPWERFWARVAVPGTVVAGCLGLGATAGAALPVLVVLAAPFAIGAIALLRALAGPHPGNQGSGHGHHDGLGQPEHAAPPRPTARIAPVIVAVATLQGVAGLAIAALGAVTLFLQRRHPDTGMWSGLGEVIAVVVLVLGALLAATFLGLAAGLHRRYRDFRPVFVVLQGLVAALLLLTVGSGWVGVGVAWALGTAALALTGPGGSRGSGASSDDGGHQVKTT
ncbi:hypothetical protein [Terrabacter sp. 2RAF25]|uniref:hypothetical protein n=1 Tax=Terrabacter sp. 2RAF25 TaxID=3232998 RepID=UPI003F9C77CC